MGFKLTDRIGFSPPFQFTGVQEEGFYEGGIDYDKLVNEIKQNNHFYFDFKNFKSGTPETQVIFPDGLSVNTGRFVDEPLYLKDKNGTNRQIKIKGRLNTREGQLDIRINKAFHVFEIDVAKKKIKYKTRIKYLFSNNLAVELTTFSYSNFSLLSEYIVIEQTPKEKELLAKHFIDAFRKVGDDLSTLDWLYENAPDFVLKKLTNPVLWEDLKKLLF